jgi:hypothetical protein
VAVFKREGMKAVPEDKQKGLVSAAEILERMSVLEQLAAEAIPLELAPTRCPRCHIRSRRPDHCPHCGAAKGDIVQVAQHDKDTE